MLLHRDCNPILEQEKNRIEVVWRGGGDSIFTLFANSWCKKGSQRDTGIGADGIAQRTCQDCGKDQILPAQASGQCHRGDRSADIRLGCDGSVIPVFS